MRNRPVTLVDYVSGKRYARPDHLHYEGPEPVEYCEKAAFHGMSRRKNHIP
ncbi:MAG: hypothetical protein ACOZBW_00835 [Thermodesulfobacteriota bacterium]